MRGDCARASFLSHIYTYIVVLVVAGGSIVYIARSSRSEQRSMVLHPKSALASVAETTGGLPLEALLLLRAATTAFRYTRRRLPGI